MYEVFIRTNWELNFKDVQDAVSNVNWINMLPGSRLYIHGRHMALEFFVVHAIDHMNKKVYLIA